MDFESEQRFHELEQRHISLKKEFEIVNIDKEALKSKVASQQSFLDQNAQQLSALERKVSDCNTEISQRDKLVQDLTLANQELNDRCRRRSEECDRLRDDLRAQASELTTLQGRLKDSQLNLNEFQSSTLPTQYELTKTIHEKNLLTEQVKYLEGELQKKAQEERNLRADSASKADELELALSEANAQVDMLTKQLVAAKDVAANQDEKMDHYMQKLRETEASLVERQGSFTGEIEGLKRLVDLYKRYFEDATAKVSELEQQAAIAKETHADVVATLRDKCTQQLQETETVAEKDRAELSSQVKALEEKLRTAEEQAQQLSSRSLVPLVEGASAVTGSGAGALGIENFDGIGITEMYDRIVQTEKELFAERSKRREVELYMQQVLKDVESKAPIIASQRRDYHRVVEAHSALARRLDVLVVENGELKQSLKTMQRRTQQAEEEAQVLEEHNADLGRQVQHLLRRSMGVEFGSGQTAQIEAEGEPQTPSGVISQYMVTFEDIQELQQRNAELLRVVRRLSKEQEQSQRQVQRSDSGDEMMAIEDGAVGSPAMTSSAVGTPNKTTQALHAALEELNNMREARKRTEEMVAVLAQQRDMYRAMAEGDSSMFRSGAGVGSPGGTVALIAEQQQSSAILNSTAVKELQAKLTQVEDDRRRLQDRQTRLEEVEQALNESLDKIRKEASAARMEAAQGTSEARFQKERAERLESALQSAQQESSAALQRRMEIERTLLDAQKEVRSREDRIAQLHDQLRVAQETQRRAEIDAEVAKASEGRLVAQLSESREETRRHVSLVEHINRIESGLQSRAQAEKEALVAENQSMKASFDTVRKQLDDRTLLDEQRSKVAEEELRSIRTRLEQKTSELASISEELTRAQLTAQAAQDRSSLLERQLSIAQERLTHSQGSQIIESSMANDYTAKELALERAQAELEALKQQLTSTEVHAEQFRKISASNETALKELRAKVAAAESQQEAEVARIRGELEAAQKDMQENRANSQSLLQEAEDAREQLRAVETEAAENIRKLEEAVALSQQECEQLKTQSATVTAEITKFQDAAKSAHQNYERELQLHATAERELSELRRLIEETKTSLQQEQQRAAQLSADCIRKEAQLVDERTRSQQETKDMKEHIAGLQYTNDLLHTQVQSYGLQIERLHEQRMLHTGVFASSSVSAVSAAAAAPGEEGVEGAAEETKSAETQPSQSDIATQPVPIADVPFDEVGDLRKATTEMREVLRYMKREKDMLQAKLSVSETENSRLVSELQSLRRSLDEVKAELKRELDKRAPVKSTEDFNRLMAEVSQMNIVRESNLHLRSENEELTKRVAVLTTSLTESQTAAIPLEENIRKLRAEKESVEMVNDQLTNDVSYWRTRLQTLISRYNDVDPEEHRLLKTKLEEVTVNLTELQKTLDEQRSASEEATAASSADTETKDKEIAALKAQVTGAENAANRLRETLRTFRDRYQGLDARVKDAEAKLAAEKETSAGLEAQIVEAKSKLEAANTAGANTAAASELLSAPAAVAAPTAAATGAPTGQSRRKRNAPGASANTEASSGPPLGANVEAVPTGTQPENVIAPADTNTTVVLSTEATAQNAMPETTPANSPTPVAATAAGQSKMARMKEALLRKKGGAAAAAAAAASASGTAPVAATPSIEAPSTTTTAAETPKQSTPVAVTGKRAAPSSEGEVDVTAAPVPTGSTGAPPAGKKRRPGPKAVAETVIATTSAEVPAAEAVPETTESVPVTTTEPPAVKTTEPSASETLATNSPVEAVAVSSTNPFAVVASKPAGSVFGATFGSAARSTSGGPFSSTAATVGSSPASSSGNLFGLGAAKPAEDSTAAAAKNPWSTGTAGKSAFGSSGFSVFGQTKTSTFGSPAPSSGSSLFGAPAASAGKSAPLFGSTSTTTSSSKTSGPFSAPAVSAVTTDTAPVSAVVEDSVPSPVPAVAAAPTGSVAILAPAPTSGPDYQQRIAARLARFSGGAINPSTASSAADKAPISGTPVQSAADANAAPVAAVLPTLEEGEEGEESNPVVEQDEAVVEEGDNMDEQQDEQVPMSASVQEDVATVVVDAMEEGQGAEEEDHMEEGEDMEEGEI